MEYEYAANALTTIETLKEHLGIPSSDTSMDRILLLYIGAGSDIIEQYTQRNFARGNYTEVFDGNGAESIYLRNTPVVEIQSITAGGVPFIQPYTLYPGSLFYSSGWPIGNRNIEIVYQGGYILPKDEDIESNEEESVRRDLPFKVELALLMLIGGIYNKKGAEGLSSSNSGGMSVQFASVFSKDVETILKPYRYYNV